MKKPFIVLIVAKLGDLIQFVQYYFNLDFKQAMEKINIDFGLNLDSNVKLDYDKIKEIINQRNKKKKQYEKLANDFKELCNKKFEIKHILESENNINILNWETKCAYLSILQDKIGIIDMQLDELLDKMMLIKNS